MLTNEQIEKNKERFLTILGEVNIPGADMPGLVDYLTNKSDFFTAPASTIYHCNYEGGLCEHSLHVFDTLVSLANTYAPNKYERTSIIIVALLHDISKSNFYEKYTMNKKKYNEKGSKHDNQGNFDWFAEEAYKVKDAKDRIIGGEHGFNSAMLVSRFIPLTYEESISIVNHHASMGEAKPMYDLSAVLNKYSLVTLLHTADFLSTFILEAC